MVGFYLQQPVLQLVQSWCQHPYKKALGSLGIARLDHPRDLLTVPPASLGQFHKAEFYGRFRFYRFRFYRFWFYGLRFFVGIVLAPLG